MKLITFITSLLLSWTLIAQQTIAFLDLEKGANYVGPVESWEMGSQTFQLNGGLILIEAKSEGKSGQYLLDTGASDLFINATNQEKSDSEELIANGLIEKSTAYEYNIELFQMGHFQKENLMAYKTDLSDFEQMTEQQVDGIIGESILNGKVLYINYDSQTIALKGTQRKRLLKKNGWTSFPLVRFEHLLAVKIDINGSSYWMGLDTGAEVNVLAEEFAIDQNMESSRTISGLTSQQANFGQLNNSSAVLGSFNFDAGDILLIPFQSVREQIGDNIDGLLGYPFFSQFEVMIDYQKSRLYLR